MSFRFTWLFAVVAAIVVALSPTFAMAQTAVFYVPPKLQSRGVNTTPIVGKGTVTVKVFVRSDGKPDSSQTNVTKSTNASNNAAALEIARTSTYKAATRDGKPSSAYYTYILKFSGAGVVNDASRETSDPTLQRVIGDERSGNYTAAKSLLATYLHTKPEDTQANLLLGVADAFTNDYVASAKALDKAGTIPVKYKTLAGRTYSNAAAASLDAKDTDTAIAYASKGIELAPSAEPYTIRGGAEYGAKKYDLAVADLEKARDLAVAEKVDKHQQAIIETNLAAAYMGAGQSEKGLAIAKEVMALDPSITQTGDIVAQYYNDKASTLVESGDKKGAADALDTGAAAVPKYAVKLYGNAATIMASDSKPDWKAVKAEADKALAIDADDARANYVAGIALANDKNTKDALTYLNKAQASAKTGSDADLSKQIDAAIKQLGTTEDK